MADTPQKTECPVCDSPEISPVIDISAVPVNCNVLFASRGQALLAPKRDIRLGFCGNCGHIHNTAFDPEAINYTEEYENSLHFSPLFQDYARSLAVTLIERYGLYGKDIIEIGCGKGDFLHLMSELGGNRGIGFDTSYSRGVEPCGNGKVVFVQDSYSEKYSGCKGDLVLCRQVLEHIKHPKGFLARVRGAIGARSGTVVFFEVPNVFHTLRELSVWDIIYEHNSYFYPYSLKRLFNGCAFNVRSVVETFEGQFICIDAFPADRAIQPPLPGPELDAIVKEVLTFSTRYGSKILSWANELKGIEESGKRAVLWGGGSKGIAFLNMLKSRGIEYVVDINTRKQGKFVPVTGQEIVAPEFL
ncbi:MAG: methyltransferase domain-containing protein, partial [Deltaproteobacteria bacterium]|nr:methyltransferase domain-containing protein [Deltaproteobacteria bacterium]